MSPTHTRGRSGKLYRYYVSSPLQKGLGQKVEAAVQRIAAPALEEVITAALARVMPMEVDPLLRLERIDVHPKALLLQIKAQARSLSGPRLEGEVLQPDPHVAGRHILTLPIRLARRGGASTIATGEPLPARRDPTLINALRRAHAAFDRDAYGLTLRQAPSSQYARRLAALALLAPDIQQAILAGSQPRDLTLATLIAGELPIGWDDQRAQLGFAAVAAPLV